MRHPDGSAVGGARNGWVCDLFEGGQKVGQVVIVRQSWDASSRFLWDADGRSYTARIHSLGVEEVATP